MSTTDYLIEGWLPARRVHLLGGPSGTGKTRWLLDTLVNHWQHGHSIFGCSSHPVPWCYVAADRDLESVQETISTLDIDHRDIKIIPAFGRHKKTWMQILEAVARSKSQLAVVEAFAGFCDEPGNNWQVRQFLSNTYEQIYPTKDCPNGITIIGVMESPKMKPNERYQNPRQRISGVATWSHSTETVIVLEPANPKLSDAPERAIYIRPRNSDKIDRLGIMTSNGRIVFP